MSISVDILPTLNVIQVSVDGQMVFIRRELCTEFLAKFMRAMADSIPEGEVVPFPGYSVKVSDPDDLMRDGEPSDDEIYSPAYVGDDGPTKAA